MLSKKKTGNQEKNKILIIFAAAAALILAAGIWAVVVSAQPSQEELLKEGTFAEGIEIAGVDVSGKTIAEAEPLIRAQAESLLGEVSAAYTVQGTEYRLTAYQLGASVELESVLREAMLYKKTKEEAEKTVSFEIHPKLDPQTLAASLEEQGKLYNTEPMDASIKVVTDESEERLRCTGKVEYTESVVGVQVDAEALAERIRAAVEENAETMPLTVEPTLTEPAVSLEDAQKNCTKMASFKTSFADSGYGRRFNIWKMSTVVNGVVLQPGEQWSINEAAGDRTTENGWADAAGIKNGAYVDEPGGGICQVSTTLYNAILRSEVKVEYRRHHSWPSNYVDVGLDATISTGGPDFIISNPYDYPIAIVVNTDAKDARTVEIAVYGPEMDYKVNFTSTIVKETEPDPETTTYDPLLSPGTSVRTSPRKKGLVVEVYKHWYDKETGEEIKDAELYYTDTYKAFSGTIAYGPSATPSPSPSASAVTDPAASASASPAPTPTAQEGGEGA